MQPALSLTRPAVIRAVEALGQRPAVSIVIGRSVGFTAAFAIPIVLSRSLDQAEFGTYKQLFLIYATLFGVAQLGMAESLYYFIPRGSRGAYAPTKYASHPASDREFSAATAERPSVVHDRHAVNRAGQHIANAVLTLAAAGVACLTLLMLSSDVIAGWLANPHISAGLLPLGVFLSLTLLTTPFEIVLVSRGRYSGAALTYAASDLVRAVCVVVPALVIGTIAAVMWGLVAFALARLVAMLWALRREVVTGFRPQLSMWGGQMAYALPFALAVGVEIVQANFHQYVVATRFDAATFAIFAVGVLQMPLVDIIATSAASVMMVKIRSAGDLDPRATLALWHDTVLRLSLVVFPLVAFMLIAAHDLILLVFTDAYAASVPIFQLSTVAILPACLCVDAVLRAHAQTRVLVVLNLVRLAAVALLIGSLLTAFGVLGAVAATLCATVLARALGLARIARLLNVRLVELLPWRQLTTTAAFAAVAALPAVWVHRVMPHNGAVALVIVAGVYGITFMALSLWKGSVSLFSMAPERVL
jgi:O-antigen/teichoic acid export membrane protein